MKKLFFIRHAKSDWSFPGLADIDRPLNERGYSDAHSVGKHLKKNSPGKIVFASSPAIRALSTALIIARETDYPSGKILLCPELYEAEINNYENTIRSLDNRFDTAFIFGHNPTISEVINYFTRTDVGEISTCSVFALRFETGDWQGITKATGKVDFQFSPKTLSDQSH